MDQEERQARVFIAFGSNLGDPVAQIERGLEDLRDSVRWDRISSVYRTPPAGYVDQPDFYNVVASGRTGVSPESLMDEMKLIEQAMGRTRSFRNAPRLIDIDLLSHGGRVLESPSLILPHPRLHLRTFVLVPLVEIAPEWVHPRLGSSAAELLRDLGTPAGIEPCGTLRMAATRTNGTGSSR